MAAGRAPQPWNQLGDPVRVRDQTMCLVPSPSPGPLDGVAVPGLFRLPWGPEANGSGLENGFPDRVLSCNEHLLGEALPRAPAPAANGAAAGKANLGDYEAVLEEVVKSYNTRLKPVVPLDPDWVRAMITGAETQDAASDARKYDPMQVANQGDPALGALQDGKEGTDVIASDDLRKRLKAKKETPRPQGKRDYAKLNDPERMDSRTSIEAGVAWLFRLCRQTREEGEVLKSPRVVQGDTLEGLAKKLGTTVDSLREHSKIPKHSSLIREGQVLLYKKTKTQYGPTAGAWEDAIKKYNWGKSQYSGRGDPKYFEKVKKKYAELKGTRT